MRGRKTLLIVEDEALFARAAMDELSDLEMDAMHVASIAEAERIAQERLVDVVLLDQNLPDGEGASLCPALIDANELCKIIFVTAYPRFENVVEALRAGAFDYLVKPCAPEALRHAVERSLRTLALERSRLAHERERERSAESSAAYFGPALEPVRKLVELAMRSDSPVFLTGETGTGKTMVARAIHFGSARKEGEFVPVNCAALPEALIEAELFGYEKGTFTGAVGARAGLFELADGGTILLDEVTELPFHLQAKLLQVLEDQTVRRLGGRSSRKVRFRLVAASNLDPAIAVATGKLREDLFHRLNVLPIRLPPLRERLTDLPELGRRLIAALGRDPNVFRLAPEELDRLARYDWPGNIRELRNVLERACLLGEGGRLRPSELISSPAMRPASMRAVAQTSERRSATLAAAEQRHVAEAVARTGGNISRAARDLGISRATLRRKLAPGP